MVRRTLIKEVDEVQDALVHIDHEDDQYESPSMKLPSRAKVLADLESAWEGIEVVNQIQRTTLHYCAGKMEIEVTIPIADSTELIDREQQAKAMKRKAEELSYVSSLKIFQAAP